MDALTLLADDHRAVESLFSEYESTSDAQKRTEITHQVIHDLAVHGEIEELVLYPELRKAVPEGDALADEAVDEHKQIKQSLNDLDQMTAVDDGFDQTMRELMAEVRHHVQEEEGEIFPRIRQAVGSERLDQLGGRMDRARRMVPTRPRPKAPTSPGGKIAAGAPALALVDRIRDAVRRAADNRN